MYICGANPYARKMLTAPQTGMLPHCSLHSIAWPLLQISRGADNKSFGFAWMHISTLLPCIWPPSCNVVPLFHYSFLISNELADWLVSSCTQIMCRVRTAYSIYWTVLFPSIYFNESLRLNVLLRRRIAKSVLTVCSYSWRMTSGRRSLRGHLESTY